MHTEERCPTNVELDRSRWTRIRLQLCTFESSAGACGCCAFEQLWIRRNECESLLQAASLTIQRFRVVDYSVLDQRSSWTKGQRLTTVAESHHALDVERERFVISFKHLCVVRRMSKDIIDTTYPMPLSFMRPNLSMLMPFRPANPSFSGRCQTPMPVRQDASSNGKRE